MAGAQKRHNQAEKKASASGSAKGSGHGNTQTPRQQPEPSDSGSRSTPQSVGGHARLDGDNDSPQKKDASEHPVVNAKNVDMGVACWATVHRSHEQQKEQVKLDQKFDTPVRPQKFNSQGTEVSIGLNTFKVTQVPTVKVFQYDVKMYLDRRHVKTDDSDKRPPTPELTPAQKQKEDEMMSRPTLRSKIWNSQAVQAELKKAGPGWLFDGHNLAWSLYDKPLIRVEMDLDKERNPTKESNGRNCFILMLKRTKNVRYDVLYQYLQGNTSWNNDCLEAFTMLDHLMREGPRNKLLSFKRSFFAKDAPKASLGGGVDAIKGVYCSLRMHWNGPGQGHGLSVNADVANGTFWQDITFLQAMLFVTRLRNPEDLQRAFSKIKCVRDWNTSELKDQLKRLNRVRVVTCHRFQEGLEFTVEKVLGLDPKQYTFTAKEGQTTLQDYWREKHKSNAATGYPVVQMTRKIQGQNIVFPIDALRIATHQRYPFKLDERQTSDMIKFAVTLPNQRWNAIKQGVELLQWDKDAYLMNYGMKISPTRTEVKGRLLPTPDVGFAGNTSIPGSQAGTGRWRIDGKKFLTSNSVPIKSWGICIVGAGSRGAPDEAAITNFFRQFVTIYRGHGGQIPNAQPRIVPGNLAKGGEMITEAWNSIGSAFQAKPNIIFFVMPDRNTQIYRRIKKGCEIRYGIPSQCLQARHILANQAQYISNVCMKVNAKLGGSTCKALSKNMARISNKHATTSTMIIGADVTHPSPGTDQASVAAITMSTNRDMTRFCAYVQSNGRRLEMITDENFNKMDKYFKWWAANVGGGRLPERVVFLRDGLSDAQYNQCLNSEVTALKSVFRLIDPANRTCFTVLIASKRHHVRFFPSGNSGDRNGNPKPGTLVECGVTNPFEFDFYLCAHSAIKGTARPVHYYCLLNECKMLPEEIQQMVYDQSYQYCRATTPISQPPAVYYAHLAAMRALCHIDDSPIPSSKNSAPSKATTSNPTDKSGSEPVRPLLEMNMATCQIQLGMWYV